LISSVNIADPKNFIVKSAGIAFKGGKLTVKNWSVC